MIKIITNNDTKKLFNNLDSNKNKDSRKYDLRMKHFINKVDNLKEEFELSNNHKQLITNFLNKLFCEVKNSEQNKY